MKSADRDLDSYFANLEDHYEKILEAETKRKFERENRFVNKLITSNNIVKFNQRNRQHFQHDKQYSLDQSGHSSVASASSSSSNYRFYNQHQNISMNRNGHTYVHDCPRQHYNFQPNGSRSVGFEFQSN